MLLHDAGLVEAMSSGAIHVSPYDERRLQPSSIDLTLDSKFRVLANKLHHVDVIDLKDDNTELMELVEVGPDDYLDLYPRDFALASTAESVSLNNQHAARVEGKSSLARLGLAVHITAGFIDPGFYGQVTLELANMTCLPIRLYPGMPIAQIAVFQMAGPCTHPYGTAGTTGKYAGQAGPTASRFHLNFTQCEP